MTHECDYACNHDPIKPSHEANMTTTPALGADKATDERIDLRALFEKLTAAKYKPQVARGLHLKNPDGSFQVSSIEMEFRAWQDGYRVALAVAMGSYSNPAKIADTLQNCAMVLDTIKIEWSAEGSWSEYDQSVRNAVSSCLASLSDTVWPLANPDRLKTSAPAPQRAIPAPRAPAPVLGMPDLAKRLNEIDRHLAKCRFTERHEARRLVYSMLHDVCGIPAPQAPDTPTNKDRS